MEKYTFKKHYGDFEMEDFFDAIDCEYDMKIITYKGRDYIAYRCTDRSTGEEDWWLCDASEYIAKAKKGKRPSKLSDVYHSLDELVRAPILDGKSIVERYDEIGKCDWYDVE